MSAILVENDLALNVSGAQGSSKGTVTDDPLVDGSISAAGHGFANTLDGNGGSTWKIGSSAQAVSDVLLSASKVVNGFAVYGHNLNPLQGIKVEYTTGTTAGSGYSDFTDAGSVYTAYYYPDRKGRAFGAYIDGNIAVRRIRITTVGWTSESYISVFSMGMFLLDGFNLSAPFTPPLFASQESTMKRNNKGNPTLTDTRKVPTKLNLNIATMEFDDVINSLTDHDCYMNGDAVYNPPFAEYIGYHVAKYPFFVMYDTGLSTDTDATVLEKRNRVYYCTVDRNLKQPAYSSPTTLKWRIPCMGYIE